MSDRQKECDRVAREERERSDGKRAKRILSERSKTKKKKESDELVRFEMIEIGEFF